MIDRSLLKKIVIGFGVIIAALIIYSIATTGRLYIENYENDGVTIIKINDSTVDDEHTVSNGAFIKSGTYMVRNDKQDQFRTVSVKVPGWMQTVSVTYTNENQVAVHRKAALTYENFLQTENNQLVSFTDLDSTISGYSVHNPTDAFGGKVRDFRLDNRLVSPVVTNDGNIIGIDEDDNLNKYNFSDNTFSVIDTVSTGESDSPSDLTKVFRSSDTNSESIGVFTPNNDRLTIFDEKGNKHTIDIKDESTQAGPFDVNKNYWAAVYSSKPSGENDDEERVFRVDTTTVGGSDQNSIDIGAARSVNRVALSPNSLHIAIIKNDQLWVYDTESKKPVFVDVFTNPNNLYWSGDDLYIVSVEAGITKLNSNTLQQQTILNTQSSGLTFSNMVMIGTKIYATAYTDNSNSRLPDGYEIDLEQNDNGITGGLLNVLPLRESTYDASFLDSTIYVRSSRYPRNESQAARTQRIDKMKQQAISQLETSLDKSILQKTSTVFLD